MRRLILLMAVVWPLAAQPQISVDTRFDQTRQAINQALAAIDAAKATVQVLDNLPSSCIYFADGPYYIYIRKTDRTMHLCTTAGVQQIAAGGIADPGLNGVLVRTALNVATVVQGSPNYCVHVDGTSGPCNLGLPDPGTNGVVVRTAANMAAVVTGTPTDCVHVDGSSGACGSATQQSTPTPPGGSDGQVQINRSGAFAGLTLGGDCTLNSTTGALTCTKTSGVSFGAAATRAVGTTAGTVADGAHNHAGVYELPLTFSAPFNRATNTISLASCGTDGYVLKYRTATGWGCELDQTNTAGTGITSLGGLTDSTQLLALGTSGTAPNWANGSATHTLNIPMASATGVTAGLLSKADYDAFAAKQAAISGAPGTWPSVFAPAAHSHDAGDVTTGVFDSARFPTLNQNTTGTAAGLTAAYIDWTSVSGGTMIRNKPTTFAPSAHASTHLPGGSDALFSTNTANTVFAAPNGSNGAPSFRPLVAADIPALSYMPALNPGTAGQVVKSNGTTWTAATLAKSDVGLGNVDNTADASKAVASATTAGAVSGAAGTKLVLGGACATLTEATSAYGGLPAAGDYFEFWDSANSCHRTRVDSTGTKVDKDAAVGGMVYPASGIPQSNGTAWISSLTLDTDGTMAANSDTRVPSQKAVATALGTKAASNASISINGTNCALGGSCSVAGVGGGGGMPRPGYGTHRWGMAMYPGSGVTPSVFGLNSTFIASTITAGATTTGWPMYVTLGTAGTVDSTATINASGSACRTDSPWCFWSWRGGLSSTTNMRSFFGYGDQGANIASLTASDTYGSGSPYAAFTYSSTRNTPNWYCVSGTTPPVITDSGVAVVVDALTDLEVSMDATSVTFKINGVTVCSGNPRPATNAQAMNVYGGIRTTEAVAKTFRWVQHYVEQ